jgi:hypothetical protein
MACRLLLRVRDDVRNGSPHLISAIRLKPGNLDTERSEQMSRRRCETAVSRFQPVVQFLDNSGFELAATRGQAHQYLETLPPFEHSSSG